MVSHRKTLPAELGSWLPVQILQDSPALDQVPPMPGLQSQQYSQIRSGSQHIYKDVIRNYIQRRSYPGYSAPKHISTELIIRAEEEKQVWTMMEDSSTSEGSDSSLDQAPTKKRNDGFVLGSRSRCTSADSSTSDMDFSTCHEPTTSRSAKCQLIRSPYQERFNRPNEIAMLKLSSRRGVRRTFPGYVVPARSLSCLTSCRRQLRLSKLPSSLSIRSPIQSMIYLPKNDDSEVGIDDEFATTEKADMKERTFDILHIYSSEDAFAEEGLPATYCRNDSAIVLDYEEIVNGFETYLKPESSRPAYIARAVVPHEKSEDSTGYDIESIADAGEDPSNEDYVYDGSDEEEINTNISFARKIPY
ncbi:hypothetical protein V1520DRAFT_342096 [Lipomyces starkeyi]|uniref:Uncharacterized protein n=1 Tax=Lipomyces starkeyi NRRL Y-11557 TaxID=675824 RepID=A0A1E3QGH8_LIPST|nr:hypothetical protein LIPSTDRAFT_25151 [Lipomyces starkeyi NRRL Y-11557]